MNPLSLFWCEWQEGNRRFFDGVNLNYLILKEPGIMPLIDWSVNDGAAPLNSIDDLNCRNSFYICYGVGITFFFVWLGSLAHRCILSFGVFTSFNASRKTKEKICNQ